MSLTNKTSLMSIILWSGSLLAADLPQDDANKHMGVASCAASQCHGSATPRDVSAVLQNEYVTWTQDDPHSRAYETLASDASRAIASRLGLSSATSADICLDCHTDNTAAGNRGDKFQVSDGVGCEACHGGSENWLSTHYNTPSVDHAANIAAGLYPTESVADRASLCLSCHLGTDDKFATHRIMAAGHPRLTFELDTFTELWRTAGRQPHYRLDNDYVERKDSGNHSYTWAAGVIAESVHRMQLVKDRVAGDTMFPELGLYDCHACHRSMKIVHWRRLPRHGNAGPGVPFLNDGSLVMVLALARAIDDGLAREFQLALAELHAAGSQDAEALRAAANGVQNLLDTLAARVTPGVIRGRERQILREVLATGAEGNYLDYVSAEQAFMAVQMLVFEIGDTSLADHLDPLGDSLDDDERYRPALFARLLADLGDE